MLPLMILACYYTVYSMFYQFFVHLNHRYITNKPGVTDNTMFYQNYQLSLDKQLCNYTHTPTHTYTYTNTTHACVCKQNCTLYTLHQRPYDMTHCTCCIVYTVHCTHMHVLCLYMCVCVQLQTIYLKITGSSDTVYSVQHTVYSLYYRGYGEHNITVFYQNQSTIQLILVLYNIVLHIIFKVHLFYV